jgi:hypothetical protein
LIERALRYQDSHTLEDVLQAIKEDRAQLWCGERSAIVTEILKAPHKRYCRIWLAGGDMDELVNEMLPEVETWALRRQCDSVQVNGRKGWQRVLVDYRQPSVVLEKEIQR